MFVVESTAIMRKKVVQELVRKPLFSSLNLQAQTFLIDQIEIKKFESISKDCSLLTG